MSQSKWFLKIVKFCWLLFPEHALFLPSISHTVQKHLHILLNTSCCKFWQLHLWTGQAFWRGKGKQSFYPTYQSYYKFSSLTNCLLFALPCPNPSMFYFKSPRYAYRAELFPQQALWNSWWQCAEIQSDYTETTTEKNSKLNFIKQAFIL